MDPTPADPPPGCLVVLLRLSAGMTADVVTSHGETPAVVAARFLADDLIEGLVGTAAAGYAVGALDVAVLGYRAPGGGALEVLSLLPGGGSEPRFVPLAEVAEMPAAARGGEGRPRKWAGPSECEGDPCPAAALAAVYQMVSVWVTGRYAARPPVVIHCTSGAGFGAGYFRTARSFGLLATLHGPARLLHYVFDEAPEGGVLERLAGPPGGSGARRTVFLNEWDIGDPWAAIFDCPPQADPIAWAGAGAALTRTCAMWAQKMGNTPEQWEDAFAVDEANGAAAIADGASAGIYCATWAQQLSQRFLADRPDARAPDLLNRWVNGLRTEWRAAINYDSLNWSKQAKVDQVGAAATWLGLELGPADESGARSWRACAVGDASLFWVRAGELLATFPVVAADQFGSAPLLVRSNPGFRTAALTAAGMCEPGDRFVLATDAVAARLLTSTGSGTDPDWARFEALAEDEWRAELDALRGANEMVNDDCTLVVLRVNEPVVRAAGAEDAELDADGPFGDERIVSQPGAGPPSAPEPPAEEPLAEELVTPEWGEQLFDPDADGGFNAPGAADAGDSPQDPLPDDPPVIRGSSPDPPAPNA